MQTIDQLKEKLIIPLDVSTGQEAENLIDELKDHVGVFKVGLQLFTSVGPAFVRKIVKNGVKVFLDLKFHDIPNTVAGASAEAARLGVWMFNLHSFGGPEMMRRAIDEVKEICLREGLARPKIIAVTILTSTDQDNLKEIGIENKTSAQVLKLAQLTAKCGLDGVVASPLEIELIKREVSKDFLLVTPGIRPKINGSKTDFETLDDQKRVMTPGQAVSLGADYLVIGRPVTKSDNKIEAVEKIIKEIFQTINGSS